MCMCGINDFNWPDKKLIINLNKSIKHRGSDDFGVFIDSKMSFSRCPT